MRGRHHAATTARLGANQAPQRELFLRTREVLFVHLLAIEEGVHRGRQVASRHRHLTVSRHRLRILRGAVVGSRVALRVVAGVK